MGGKCWDLVRRAEWTRKWQRKKYQTDPAHRAKCIASSKAYYEAHKDEPEFRARRKAYYVKTRAIRIAEGKEYKRRRGLAEFGLTEWGRECEICGGHDELSRDHDHSTGRWRGWLCKACNLGLGYFRDSPERLEKAMNYLTKDRSIRLGVR